MSTKMAHTTLGQLRTADHHSIRLRVGIDDRARHPGGVNIFGKGFGNHNHNILMRQHLEDTCRVITGCWPTDMKITAMPSTAAKPVTGEVPSG